MIKKLIEFFSYKKLYEDVHVEFKKMEGHVESYQDLLKRCQDQRDRAMDKAEKYQKELSELYDKFNNTLNQIKA